MSESKIQKITEDEKKHLKNLTVFSLPDSPRDFGMRAAQVKPKFWKALADGEGSVVWLINRVIDDLNEILGKAKNAYDLALANGFKGSMEEWLKSLRGVGIESAEFAEGKLSLVLTNGETPSVTLNGMASKDNVSKALEEAKDYTDNELATFDFIKVVKPLPEAGLPNRIYLVPKDDAQENDFFDEYIWVNKGTEEEPKYEWEWITTKQIEVDLTPYVRADAAVETINQKVNLIDTTALPSTLYANFLKNIKTNTDVIPIAHLTGGDYTFRCNVDGYTSTGDDIYLNLVDRNDTKWIDKSVKINEDLTFSLTEELASQLCGAHIWVSTANGEGHLGKAFTVMLNKGDESVPYQPWSGGDVVTSGALGCFGNAPTGRNAMENIGLIDAATLDIEADTYSNWLTKLQNYAKENVPMGSKIPFFMNAGWKDKIFGNAVAWSTTGQSMCLQVYQPHADIGVRFFYYIENAGGWREISVPKAFDTGPDWGNQSGATSVSAGWYHISAYNTYSATPVLNFGLVYFDGKTETWASCVHDSTTFYKLVIGTDGMVSVYDCTNGGNNFSGDYQLRIKDF